MQEEETMSNQRIAMNKGTWVADPEQKSSMRVTEIVVLEQVLLTQHVMRNRINNALK